MHVPPFALTDLSQNTPSYTELAIELSAHRAKIQKLVQLELAC